MADAENSQENQEVTEPGEAVKVSDNPGAGTETTDEGALPAESTETTQQSNEATKEAGEGEDSGEPAQEVSESAEVTQEAAQEADGAMESGETTEQATEGEESKQEEAEGGDSTQNADETSGIAEVAQEAGEVAEGPKDTQETDEAVESTQVTQEATEDTQEATETVEGESAEVPQEAGEDTQDATETVEGESAEVPQEAGEAVQEAGEPEKGADEPAKDAEATEVTDSMPEAGPELTTESGVDAENTMATKETNGSTEAAETTEETTEEKDSEDTMKEPADDTGKTSAGKEGVEEGVKDEDLSQMERELLMENVGDDQVIHQSESHTESVRFVEPPPPPPLLNEESKPTNEEVETPPTALHPVWSFGLNRHIPVINLSNPSRSWIFYACAHLGIIYDVSANTQTVLQGHSNAITCTAASADKRWLVTGDKGADSLIVIWDSVTGMPVRSMFEPHPNGVVAVALTPDARYLATLSAEPVQTFAIWDWTTGDELPLCSATLSPDYGIQNYIMFNPADISHVVTNSESQVLFFCWKGGKLEYFAPPLTDKDFNKPVGKYSNSIFLSDSTRALTATSQGLIVVWDSNSPLTKSKFGGWKLVLTEATPDKKAVKLVPMHDRGINVLTSTGDMIVTGDTAGVVKFFDQSLQLTYWYQNFNFGPINSLSFAHNANIMSEEEALTSRYPNDCTIPSNRFICRDYVLGTSTAVFATVDVNGTVVKVVHRDHDAPVHALAAHPSLPRIIVGGFSGLLKVWNYQKKSVEVSRYFERGNQIRCCSYDPNGIYIALGFVNGVVRVLDALTLKDVTMEPFHYAREEVTHVAFSMDSTLLATADGDNTTTLFRRAINEDEDTWIYVGRHRAHYKPICDVLFGVHLDSGVPRLLTLGLDRFLVEYDIPNSSKDNLPILQKDRIEQSACPLSMTWYPPITKEQFLCTSNDQFKLKLYNTTTKMCRKTLLGPTYGSPINKMCVVSNPSALPTDRRYLSYIIKDKVGLVILPLDGNPHNSMCLVAHPGGVTNLASSYDGKYIFTSGGTDTSVHMWAVHTNVLDAQSLLGGEDLIPFYGLLEGGREGQLFAELEDYFYYAQLRSQGNNTMDSRKVSTHIPISEVPFVMRALGFYPTEQEIEDMMNEIKFSRYVDTGEYVTRIDLGGFIRLFVNHRPAFGLDIQRIAWAFDKLGQCEEGKTPIVDRMDLLDILQSRGEHMSEYELAECITTLLGYNPEGGSCELEEFDPSNAGDIIEANLANVLDADVFTRDLLALGILSQESTVKEKLNLSKQSTEVQTAD